MRRSFAVTIAGQRFALKTDADEAYVHSLAGYVEEKIRGIRGRSRPGSSQEVALLAALQVADELFQERQVRADLRRRVRTQVRRMLTDLAPPGPMT